MLPESKIDLQPEPLIDSEPLKQPKENPEATSKEKQHRQEFDSMLDRVILEEKAQTERRESAINKLTQSRRTLLTKDQISKLSHSDQIAVQLRNLKKPPPRDPLQKSAKAPDLNKQTQAQLTLISNQLNSKLRRTQRLKAQKVEKALTRQQTMTEGDSSYSDSSEVSDP